MVIEVERPGSARLLAVRDEDPQREWDALGPWWPEEYPGVIGIRDRRAGGAWLAVDPERGRLAVLLNRADVQELSDSRAQTRGTLALESVAGRSPDGPLPMHGFNLLEVRPEGARVLSWDGVELRETAVTPGTHMVAHDDLDDPVTPRIRMWLPRFRALGSAARSDDWTAEWIALLGESAELPPDDDRAIIRDNRPHGYPTQSLLYATAALTPAGVEVSDHTLPGPAHWG